ncbi:hypothetical protein K503DRAFT_119623 [Rhizopogon vinicolor AM-OR11-026]|uniref:Uncharacterized protein n=1 Tax=Rhizopogon vinicolor AM-OR11-026 TaxID=1314800 RepID=A0A1B7MES2_9AGAM|nr:hypothetical protein K503DRAFT_119623 [Rhizopogon vinicolor AM-OR11-026]
MNVVVSSFQLVGVCDASDIFPLIRNRYHDICFSALLMRFIVLNVARETHGQTLSSWRLARSCGSRNMGQITDCTRACFPSGKVYPLRHNRSSPI